MEIHVPLLTVLSHCFGVCRGAKTAQAVSNETILIRVFAFVPYFTNNIYQHFQA
jgi:hypothetical protein